jgi:hypothetical protein
MKYGLSCFLLLALLVSRPIAYAGTTDKVLDSVHEALDPVSLAAKRITELDLDGALKTLAPLDAKKPDVAYQWARLYMVRGACEEALPHLNQKAVLEDNEDARYLAQVALTCTRAMAATEIVADTELVVRLMPTNRLCHLLKTLCLSNERSLRKTWVLNFRCLFVWTWFEISSR